LINCPECGKQISDKAEACIFCGLPSSYFSQSTDEKNIIDYTIVSSVTKEDGDYNELRNILVVFDRDYLSIFSEARYIPYKEIE
jgi:uncharacterized OB-fold protein